MVNGWQHSPIHTLFGEDTITFTLQLLCFHWEIWAAVCCPRTLQHCDCCGRLSSLRSAEGWSTSWSHTTPQQKKYEKQEVLSGFTEHCWATQVWATSRAGNVKMNNINWVPRRQHYGDSFDKMQISSRHDLVVIVPGDNGCHRAVMADPDKSLCVR